MARVVACRVIGVVAWVPKFRGMMTWRGLAAQIRDEVKDALMGLCFISFHPHFISLYHEWPKNTIENSRSNKKLTCTIESKIEFRKKFKNGPKSNNPLRDSVDDNKDYYLRGFLCIKSSYDTNL